MSYWKTLIPRAWNDTLAIMGGASTCTVMVAIAAFVCTMVIIRKWRGHETMKDLMIETICGVLGTVLVGLAVFVIHVIFITPGKIYAEDHPENTSNKTTQSKHTPKIIISPSIQKPDQTLKSIIETQKEFDVISPENANKTNELEKIRAAAKEQRQKTIDARNADWKTAYPIFKREIIKLHDVLYEKAQKLHDDIIQPSDYFDCLPQSIDPFVGSLSLAKIALKNNTNWNFSISINSDADWKLLRIACPAGWSELRTDAGGFHRWLQFSDEELSSNHSEKVVPAENVDGLMDETLGILMEAQLEFEIKRQK